MTVVNNPNANAPGPSEAAVSRATESLTVAIDVGPLLGPLTGVGVAVRELISHLGDRDDLSIKPYACSFRGQLQPGMTRLPLPAAVAQRLWSRFSFPRLDRWMRPARVVHGTNYTVGPSRLPRVVSVYDCWFLRHTDQANDDVSRAGQVLRRAVDSGAIVHASSHATADGVREMLGAERVEVIPLGPLPLPEADPDRAVPVAELDGVPFVLAVGTLERRKNLPRLVAAFGELAPQHSDLRLVLAGADGDDRDAVNAAIDALAPSVQQRVVLTSRVDDHVKEWLYSRAMVLAYPSLDEGFGFPLLEAMQRRVPVVASSAGSIPEVAGDAAVLVDPHDVTALATAIDTVLTDRAVAQRLLDAGDERLKVYSWSSTADRLAELYARLAQEHG